MLLLIKTTVVFLWIRNGFRCGSGSSFVTLNADPHPDPGSQINADPDPDAGQTLPSIKKFNFYMKNIRYFVYIR
jgi:hypothetical protein